MNRIADVIVIGSGPSGAQAAKQVLEEGYSVALLDFGNYDAAFPTSVPDQPFSELRRGDTNQRAYFLGNLDVSSIKDVRVGAHLSAPRSFITRDVDLHLPLRSDSFFPLQSLALGGLGAGWGAGIFTFEQSELQRAGLPPNEMRQFYDAVARDIGVSGAYEDDTAPYALEVSHVQPPLSIDCNARTVMQSYAHSKRRLQEMGFVLGRAPLAVLSKAHTANGIDRSPNPYFDMDFYGDSRRSVYRPRYSIEEMSAESRFRYLPGLLVNTVRENEGGDAEVHFTAVGDGISQTVSASKVLIAAGALSSARIVLRSLGAYGQRVPLLCNPYHYVPGINTRMIGRAAEDARYSLCQLLGVLNPQHREGERVTAALYSYRSLLLYKLIKEMPLPPALGLMCARVLATSLTIAGIHHPDKHSPGKWLELRRHGSSDVLAAGYEIDESERRQIREDLAGVKRALRKLSIIPFACMNPGWGSSIHYAGTIPSNEHATVARSDANGKLIGSNSIFLADSSPWNYLPAKGLTFTLMANARRVARVACRSLRLEHAR